MGGEAEGVEVCKKIRKVVFKGTVFEVIGVWNLEVWGWRWTVGGGLAWRWKCGQSQRSKSEEVVVIRETKKFII